MPDVTYPLIYDWHGHLVNVEFYEGPADLSGSMPPGPSDVSEGETAVLFWLANGSNAPRNGWWTSYEKFTEHAEPFDIDALKYEGEW